MQKISIVLHYHQRSYELVKFGASNFAYWNVYTYSINGRGEKLFGFTDVGYTSKQAEHMAKHLLRMYRLGKEAGRKEIKEELKNLVDTEQV